MLVDIDQDHIVDRRGAPVEMTVAEVEAGQLQSFCHRSLQKEGGQEGDRPRAPKGTKLSFGKTERGRTCVRPRPGIQYGIHLSESLLELAHALGGVVDARNRVESRQE